MSKLDQLKQAEHDWQKGVLLAELLSEKGAGMEDYLKYLSDESYEIVFSEFNIKRFLEYWKAIQTLDDGFYWVFVEEGDKHPVIAEYSCGLLYFTVDDIALPLEEIYLINTQRLEYKEEL